MSHGMGKNYLGPVAARHDLAAVAEGEADDGFMDDG